MKVYRKVAGEIREYDYSGRNMEMARAEVASCTDGDGAILIDVGTIPPAPPFLVKNFGPCFGTSVTPVFM